MPFIKNRFFLLLLTIDSGIVFWLGWPVWHLAFILFFAFISLLLLEEHISNLVLNSPGNSNNSSFVIRHPSFVFFLYSFLTFLIWNALTTWWICNSTFGGGVFVILANSFLMSIPFLLFRFTKNLSNKKLGYISFIVYWLSFEYLHLNWDLSWPWLTLGNGFAMFPQWIQWYEYTGVLGGSLWILIINLFLFFGLRTLIFKSPLTDSEAEKTNSLKAGSVDFAFNKFEWKKFIIPALLILVPITFSYYKYAVYQEIGDPVNVVVVQPNVDPYNEKFHSSPDFIPYEEQLNRLISLSENKLDSTVNYLVWPETALPMGYWEDDINTYSLIQALKSFLQKYPNLILLTGVDTYIEYDSGKNASETARYRPNIGYYDAFNTAMQITHKGEISFYHKSKLVPGVEKMPYPKFFKFLESLTIDMGGISGSLGKQKKRTVFFNHINLKSKIKNRKSKIVNRRSIMGIAPAICYESIYGEFISEYIFNGANFIFIITNDGWWKDTPGYKQHLNYASLRAIETRRSIARSANTGISCFVNQKGDIMQTTDWSVQAVIKGTIISNDEITFYTKYGDYIGRVSIFLAIAIFLSTVVKYLIILRNHKF